MKTEMILLYTTLALALLTLLCQIIWPLIKKNTNENITFKKNEPYHFLKQAKQNTWIKIVHTNGQRWEGFFLDSTYNGIKMEANSGLKNFVPSTLLNESVIELQPIPHIKPVEFLHDYHRCSKRDLDLFLETNLLILAFPKYTKSFLLIPNEVKICVWILKENYDEFQNQLQSFYLNHKMMPSTAQPSATLIS